MPMKLNIKHIQDREAAPHVNCYKNYCKLCLTIRAPTLLTQCRIGSKTDLLKRDNKTNPEPFFTGLYPRETTRI